MSGTGLVDPRVVVGSPEMGLGCFVSKKKTQLFALVPDNRAKKRLQEEKEKNERRFREEHRERVLGLSASDICQRAEEDPEYRRTGTAQRNTAEFMKMDEGELAAVGTVEVLAKYMEKHEAGLWEVPVGQAQ